ncbi:MAG: O-antigen ligase family protein [Gaiellaceae bacterium]
MRTAAVGATTSGRAAPVLALAAGAALFCALFFSNGSSDDPLVWIGGAALVAAALAAAAVAIGGVGAPLFSRVAAAFFGCFGGLVLWMGLSILWSSEPGRSWSYTNRTLAYLGFACLGLLVGALVPRAFSLVAGGLAMLLGALFVWALLAKCVPSLYPDYGRIARLRSPVEYWNALALLGDVAVGLALWVAAPRLRRRPVRAAGVTLLYVALVGILLTYSRLGIVLAALVAVLWLLLDRARVEGLAALLIAGAAAAGVFAVALALPGISKDGQTHAQRAHDGWRFGLVLLAGATVAWAAAAAAAAADERRPLGAPSRARIERLALRAGAIAAIAGLVLAIILAGRIWHAFKNPVSLGQSVGRLGSASSSNRWSWWQEAWDAFTGHPFGGTGAGSFELTNRLHRTSPFDVATSPHNTPLQFLSDTGIIGLLLWLGAAASAAVGIVRARAGRDGDAVTALAVGLVAWSLHLVVDQDWGYVALCGPLLFVVGVLLATGAREPIARRRPLLAAGSVAFAAVTIYSLASPWLARRELDQSAAAFGASDLPAAIDHAKTAHSYDPLSVFALDQWAGLEDFANHPGRARELYRQAIRIEPLNPDAWYELGAFEYDRKNWVASYLALDRSWGLDRQGPAGEHCGLLDRVRRRVKGYGVSCPKPG